MTYVLYVSMTDKLPSFGTAKGEMLPRHCLKMSDFDNTISANIP